MNERIEALKKLATKEVWGNNPHNGSPEFDGYELDADMFAKSIVLECVQVVNAADESCEDYYGPIIKEHFGVEE